MPEEVWRNILRGYVGDTYYLFVAPVCRKWHKQLSPYTKTKSCHIMASSATIRESGQSRGGRQVLSGMNAWSFLAEHVAKNDDVAKMADELADIIDWDEFSVVTAGRQGNFAFFNWLTSQKKHKWDPELALSSCALGRNLVLLKHMYNLGYVPGRRSCEGAALAGSVEILSWLQEIATESVDTVTQVLAEEGNLGALKWAISEGFVCDKNTLEAAKYQERLEVVRFLSNRKETNKTVSQTRLF